jgi:hypothetical protein
MRVSLRPWTLRRDDPRHGAGAMENLYSSSDAARRAARDLSTRARPTATGPAPLAETLEGRTLLAAAPADLLAPARVGAEFGINTRTAGSQEFFSEAPCAVATADDGSFVVTWSSSGQDGSSWGVYAQRFAAGGARRGGEFQVNQSSQNSQWYSSVASDADGDFVVTWTSYLQDGSESGVYARRYNSAGLALGDEFRVNSTAAGNQRQSTVAMDDDGDFVVAWSGFAQSGGAGWDVYAQRYTAAGAKAGGEFRVNGTTAGDQQYASVAADALGNFVVAWTTDGQDGSGTAVCARRYSSQGIARSAEFRVNSFTTGNQQYARVASDHAGDFVVAWASAGEDGSARGIYARRYGAAGAALGGEFAVNQTTAGEQFAPTIAADSSGNFVVTWTTADQDGSAFGIYAHAYAATGEARGGEFPVNSTTTGNQAFSSVAVDPLGGMVIAWESDGQDGSFFGIYGQRFGPPAPPPPPATIAGRHLFYNNSAFDGETPGAAAADDDAIATDKQALLSGVPSTFANYSAYSRGINGVMIDIAGLVAAPGAAGTSGAAGASDAAAITAADFSCRVGNVADAGAWDAAPAPLSVTVRPGAGAGGSDRVTLVWPDGAIKNQWLQVTVNANPRTRLAAPDVFCFGNMIGDSGAGLAAADRLDFVRTRVAFSAEAVPVTNPYDHNRDGRVNLLDLVAIRRNVGQVPLVPLGGKAVAAPASGGGAGEATIASVSLASVSDLLAGEADSLTE